MSRSLSYLRRGLFGAAFVGSMGFGVTQALAAPAQASSSGWCTEEWEMYCDEQCYPLNGHCRSTGPYVWCECGPDAAV